MVAPLADSLPTMLFPARLLLANIVLYQVFAIQTLSAIPATWAVTHFGPDGPWNVIRVHVGLGKHQQFGAVYPNAVDQTFVLSLSFCANTAPDTSCLALRGGGYNATYSTSSNLLSAQTEDTKWQAPLSQEGSSFGVSDAIFFDRYEIWPALNSSFQVVDDSYTILPNGMRIPVEVGALSMGASVFNNTFDAKANGSVMYNVPESYLFANGSVPSASVGLHIGSAAHHLNGSFIVGGYDSSRVLGDVAAQPCNTDGFPFTISLLDVWLGVVDGYSSPLPYRSRHGILADDGPSTGSNLTVAISPATPYMFLPRSTCDALTRDLPVQFQSRLGYYVWNASDPRYGPIVSSASFVAFDLATSTTAGNLTIRVPMSLMNLTLNYTISNPPTQYFPCLPVNGNYTLGRAFLQAAFLGVNWKPDKPPGTWFLAQAPGPYIPPDSVTIMINGTQDSIAGSNVQWEDTWSQAWLGDAIASASSGVNSSTVAGQSSGPSTAAQAGIGVGVAVGVLIVVAALAMLSLRRRRAQVYEKSGSDSPPSATNITPKPAITTNKHFFQELSDSQVHEMHADLGDGQRAALAATLRAPSGDII